MYICSLITIKINAMEGCFKWLVILILVLIFVPIIIGGGLLAALIAFLSNIFADGGGYAWFHILRDNGCGNSTNLQRLMITSTTHSLSCQNKSVSL